MRSTAALGGRLDQQAEVAAAVVDARDVEVVRQLMEELAGEEVPWPLEAAAHGEVPTLLGYSDCGCEKRPDDVCTRPPSNSEAEKVEMLRAELANHERTYSRTRVAASQ